MDKKLVVTLDECCTNGDIQRIIDAIKMVKNVNTVVEYKENNEIINIANRIQIIDLIEKDIAINCKTEESAEEFLTMLQEKSFKWRGGKQNLLNSICWDEYKDKTCYILEEHNEITYCDMEYCLENDYKIFEYGDYNED